MLRRIAFGLMLALLVALPAMAQDFQKGMAAYKRGDYASALKEWRPLAKEGHAPAQTKLGAMYYAGQGVPQDYAEAAKWHREAAEQGFALGQSNLGFQYLKGHGVPQDYAEAVKWYRKAAEQGNVEAQNKLAVINSKGLITARPKTPSKSTVAAQSNLRKTIIRKYRDWSVLREQHPKGIACSAISLPFGLRQNVQLSDVAGVTIGHVPTLGLFNVTKINFFEKLKPNSNVEVVVDGHTSQFGPVGESSLLSFGEKNIRLIRQMMVGTKLRVRYISRDGTHKTQNYSLLGFTSAYKRTSAECQVAKNHVVQREVATRRSPKRTSKATKQKLKGLGSGFFISSKGEVLTNLHVVEGCREVIIGKERVLIIARDKPSDLALLSTDIKPEIVPKFRLGRGIRLGEDIVVAGFPLRLLLGSGLSVTKGTMSRLKGLGGEPPRRQLLHSRCWNRK